MLLQQTPTPIRIRWKKPQSDWSVRVTISGILLIVTLSFAQGQAIDKPAGTNTVVLPATVPDPIEPFNRAMWAVNKGILTGVIKPTSRVYRFVVVKPVRVGIERIGNNLIYPVRLINNLLQGKWSGARDESYRFLCNSTVGVAGFFDVALKWNIHKSDADFGQTFGQWGWNPRCYLMLPIIGPSNERDALGFAADTAANPLLYISPYKFEANNPLTYLGPYTYLTYAVRYNNLSDTVGETIRFSQAEMDAYSEIQYAWTFARKNRVANFQVHGTRDESSLETLESVFFSYNDPEFPGHGRTRSVLIPATGRQLKFTYWLQPKEAPVVYIIPGLGAHRMSSTALALAELVYKNGFSAVCISSAFHSEFMENASTANLPAYLPVDGRDVHVALTEIDRRLHVLYPNRLGEKVLMGYSMGALESLYIAATEATNRLPLVAFDRYVAFNTPVRLLHGVSMLDDFYRAPLEWPDGERVDNIQNTFLKVADLSKETLAPNTALPFSSIESRFLIGLSFRFTLRDIIYSSQKRNNQGVLHHAMRSWKRGPLYEEILGFSYRDYFDRFVIPYYQSRGMAPMTADAVESAGDLRTYGEGVRGNPKVHVVVNQNDFLLEDSDVAWLRSCIAQGNLTVFPQGGHMGNLFNPAVQRAIVDTMAGMKAVSNGVITP